MSGYGVPQGPTPGSPRSGKAPALPVLELVGVGLAFLAFIIAFLPWAKPDVPDGVDADVDSASGWQLPLPTAITVLLLVAAVLVATPLLSKPAPSADAPASPVPALLADIAALLAIVFVIVGTKFLGAELSRGIGTWLGLVLALGAGAVLTVSWLQRSGRMSKPAPAGPSNWSQQQGQPQGWGQPQGYGQQPSYGQQQPPSYGQQQQPPAYGGGTPSYGGPSTGGQPAQPYEQPQQPPQQPQYPPQSGGGYPPQPGGYHPQG